MDYRDDPCRSKFTQGQADRMHLMATTYRSSLIGAANPASVNCVQNPNSIEIIKYRLARIYPNPVSEIFIVELLHSIKGRISIYDWMGKEIFSMDISQSQSQEIDMSNSPKGIYLLQIEDSITHSQYFEKIVKR